MKRGMIKKKLKEPMIDGWGLIILVIGIALLLLGNSQESKNTGIILLSIGIIRILYILLKYNYGK